MANTIVYLFLNSQYDVIFVGTTRKPLKKVIKNHHLDKLVFLETTRIVYSEWEYDSKKEIINFLRPKLNEIDKCDNTAIKKKFLRDFLTTQWYDYRDKEKAILKVDKINLNNHLFLKRKAQNRSNQIDYLKDQFLFHGLEGYLEKLNDGYIFK